MNKMTEKMTIVFVATIALTMSAGPVFGAYLLDYHDGSTERPFDDWVGGYEWATGSSDGSAEASSIPENEDLGGLGDDGLEVDPVDQALGEQEVDYFYTTDSALIGDGDLTGYNSIRFDFYANGTAPERIGAYFYSDYNDTYWLYEIGTGLNDTGWETYDFAFNSGSWTSYNSADYTDPVFGGAGAPDANELGNVTQIGFSVAYLEDNTTQVYGVDDFGLTVPEPETYLVLGMALLSVVIVFRKRISESLAEARTIMHL